MDSSPKIRSKDFPHICRICLITGDLKPLVDDLFEIFALISKIEVSENDALPTNICIMCSNHLHEIRRFSEKCQANDAILRLVLETEGKEAKITILDDGLNLKQLNFDVKSKDNDQDNDYNPDYKYSQDSIGFINVQHKLVHQDISSEPSPPNCSYSKELKCQSGFSHHSHQQDRKLGLIGKRKPGKEKRVRLNLRCHICDKLFSSRSGFQYHKLKHDGIIMRRKYSSTKKCTKAFLCNFCAKSFYIKSNLDAHLRTHTGENPFRCNYCSRQFRQKSSLNRHISVHTNSERNLFLCKICEKSFTTKAHRDIHVRIHTGEKPYRCEYCQKSFNYRSQWRIHLRLHTGETPFQCSACNRTYHDKGSLQKHQKKKCNFAVQNDAKLDLEIPA